MANRARLRVPARQVPAFEALQDLSDAEFTALVGALEGVPTFDLSTLESQVVAAVPALAETADTVIDMLLSVDVLRNQRRDTREDTASALVEADGMPGDAEQHEVIASRLARLLGTRALAVTSKAMDLLYANERNYIRSRIVAEIRPVFGDDPTESFKAAVVAHRLEIDYVDPAGHDRTMQFALDSSDLVDLRATLDRAETKSVVVRDFIQDSGLVLANPLEKPDES
jgi:hypothetical protein